MSKPLPLGRSLLLSLVLALGVACAWGAAMLWIVSAANSAGRGTYEILYLRRDGEPVILRYVDDVSRGVFTLDGEPVKADVNNLLYPHYVQPRPLDAGPFGVGWDARLAAASDQRQPPTYWYLVHNGQANGRAYGVGYDAISKRLVGYFGRRGFSQTLPPEGEWFQIVGDYGLRGAMPEVVAGEPTWNTTPFLYLLADDKLWSIDLGRRAVKPLLDAPRVNTVGWAWSLPDEPRGAERTATSDLAADRKLFLRSADSAALVDPDSDAALRFPLPEDARQASVAAFELADGNVLLVSMRRDPAADLSISTIKLLRIDSDGAILETRSVELSSLGGGPGGLAAIAWATLLVEPMPLASGLLTFLYPLAMTVEDAGDSYAAELARMLAQTWPSLLVALLIGALAATAAHRRQRRFGLRGAAAWAAFAFVFGAPGWLAYRFHRRWPPLDACPACGRVVPRDRDACRQCEALFPPPPLRGNEVFA
jgi:hypothetical protein